MTDGSREGCRFHILLDKLCHKICIQLLILVYLDCICTFYLEKGPKNVLRTSDNDLAERNPLQKRTEFKRKSSKYKNNTMVMSYSSNNLYVPESSLLFDPLQLHQQCSQVPDIHPSLMQRRSQG